MFTGRYQRNKHLPTGQPLFRQSFSITRSQWSPVCDNRNRGLVLSKVITRTSCFSLWARRNTARRSDALLSCLHGSDCLKVSTTGAISGRKYTLCCFKCRADGEQQGSVCPMWSCDFERKYRVMNAQDGLQAICLSSEDSSFFANEIQRTDFHADSARSQVFFLMVSGRRHQKRKLPNVRYLQETSYYNLSSVLVCFSLSCSISQVSCTALHLRCYVVVRKVISITPPPPPTPPYGGMMQA